MFQFKTPRRGRALLVAAALAFNLAGPLGLPALAQSQRVLVVVGDRPITDYDVTQRIKLDDALGVPLNGTEAERRKQVLQDLIDEVIKRIEAKANKLEPTDKQVNTAIERMAKGGNSTTAQLEAKLKAKGISMRALEKQVAATIGFNWLLSNKYKINVKVDPAEVDRRLANFTSDPRLKPVQVYNLMEISLPVESTSQANATQVLYARAIEARQIIKRFKGCSSARRAIAGVYNVHLSKTIQAPVERLPDKMRAALNETGPGGVVGPMRTTKGIQLVAFCGRSTVAPPKPTRDMVKNMLLNEKYKVASERIMRDLRRSVFIDYKLTN